MIKKVLAVSFMVVVGMSISAFAQSNPTGPKKNGRRTISKRDLAKIRSSLAEGSVRSLLRKRVSEVDWDEIPVEDVVEWLREQSEGQINILFRWSALGADGVDADTPISLKLRNVTVAAILIEVVDQLSPAGEVTFHGIGNRLIVSTKQDLNRRMYLRVYEVSDILFLVPDFGESAPQVDLEQAARSGGSGGGGSGQSPFSGSSSSTDDLEQEEQEMEERIEDLQTLIRVTIAPDSWRLADGSGLGQGSITVFDVRFLIVKNTMEVHEELAGWFSFAE